MTEGFEYQLLAIGLTTIAIVHRAGKWSLDRWLATRRADKTKSPCTASVVQHAKAGFAFISALTASSLLAGIQTSHADSNGTFAVEDNFQSGWHEATVGSVVYFSNVIRANNRPDINYASGFLQAAYTVTSPGSSDGPFRGSLQLVPEVFGAGIFHGPGTYVAGGTFWLRYNFIRPGWRIVPFIQGGGGGTSLDIPHNYDGKDFNFNLDLDAGARCFIMHRCSVNAEYRFQHISNADLWSHNIGVNTSGPSLSISLFF